LLIFFGDSLKTLGNDAESDRFAASILEEDEPINYALSVVRGNF